jgi:two-component system, OmpR family, sensor histidine kinase KdpD
MPGALRHVRYELGEPQIQRPVAYGASPGVGAGLALRHELEPEDYAGPSFGPPAASPTQSTDGWLLVAVSSSQNAARLVRLGKTLADRWHTDWIVVWVQTPRLLGQVSRHEESLIEIFRLAESLGAETEILNGLSVAATLARYAEVRHVGRILVGAPQPRRWLGWLHRSTPAALLRTAPTVRLIVAPIQEAATESVEPVGTYSRPPDYSSRLHSLSRYLRAIGLTGLCTLIAFPMFQYFDPVNIVMIYLLGATLAGLRLGRGPAALTAVANIILFDFFFVPPRYSFYIAETQYLFTIGVMLIIALVIANLMVSVRQQTEAADAREHRTALLYALSRELAAAADIRTMTQIAARHITAVFRCRALVIALPPSGVAPSASSLSDPEAATMPLDDHLVQWVATHSKSAGPGTSESPDAPILYLPLRASVRTIGVLAIEPADKAEVRENTQRRMLQALAAQVALSLERAQLAHMAEEAHVAAERASLRNTLLAAISHDLRAPLAAIAGAGNLVAQTHYALDAHRRTTLGRLIEEKARDMTTLLTNVLELLRLESDAGVLKADWHSIEDLVGTALTHTEHRLAGWQLITNFPSGLPLIYVDASLVVQLIVNLLENAVKYTPPDTTITLSAKFNERLLTLQVEDNGPGFGERDPELMFSKFQRGREESEIAGLGLGLAICRVISELHGGSIRASNGHSGGARFEVDFILSPAVTDTTGLQLPA